MCTFKPKLKRLLALCAVIAGGIVYSTSALAIGTPADTDIDNYATVDFKVGGIAQTAIDSATTTFKVDQVVDLTVAEADGEDTNVSPGETGAIARFTVTNTGNATQDFNLSVADLVGGTVFNDDTIQTDALTIVVDANGNNVYDEGTDVATFIDELSAVAGSNTVSVFVLATIPSDAGDGDAANIRLTATAHKAGTSDALGAVEAESGVNDDAGLQIVFSNNTGTADDSYLVGAATLDVVKSSVVLSDPLGATAPAALAIPGAVVEYTITITNNGGTPATEIVISDDIQSDLTLETGNYSTQDIQITKRDSTVVTCTASTADSDGCGLAGNTLTVSIPTTVDADGISVLAASAAPQNVVVIKFQVSIN